MRKESWPEGTRQITGLEAGAQVGRAGNSDGGVRATCTCHVFLLLFFWPHHAACGILAPRPGIEPGPLAVKAQSPKHWTPGYSHVFLLLREERARWVGLLWEVCTRLGLEDANGPGDPSPALLPSCRAFDPWQEVLRTPAPALLQLKDQRLWLGLEES